MTTCRIRRNEAALDKSACLVGHTGRCHSFDHVAGLVVWVEDVADYTRRMVLRGSLLIRLGIRSQVHLNARPFHCVGLLLPHIRSTHQVWGCRAVCRDTGCAQTLSHTISLCFNLKQTNRVQTPREMAATLPPSPPAHLTRAWLSPLPPPEGSIGR